MSNGQFIKILCSWIYSLWTCRRCVTYLWEFLSDAIFVLFSGWSEIWKYRVARKSLTSHSMLGCFCTFGSCICIMKSEIWNYYPQSEEEAGSAILWCHFPCFVGVLSYLTNQRFFIQYRFGIRSWVQDLEKVWNMELCWLFCLLYSSVLDFVLLSMCTRLTENWNLSIQSWIVIQTIQDYEENHSRLLDILVLLQKLKIHDAERFF